MSSHTQWTAVWCEHNVYTPWDTNRFIWLALCHCCGLEETCNVFEVCLCSFLSNAMIFSLIYLFKPANICFAWLQLFLKLESVTSVKSPNSSLARLNCNVHASVFIL